MKQFLPARPLLPTVLLLLLALLVRPALASHLLGGELTYRYIDNGGPAAAPLRYEITVTVYNNCSTIGNPSAPYPSATVGIYNQATGAKLVLTTVNYAGITGGSLLIQQTTLSNCISPPVPTGCTITGPSQPFKVQKFIALVNLPTQPAGQGYHVVFSESARNAGITNLVGSDGQNLELYTTMTPPTIFNRSPVFANTAVAVICANDTSYYLNNAIDADGDRLEYAFGQPYRAPLPTGTTPFNPPPTGVTYAAGFSAGAPFGTGRGAISHIDTNSGIATYGTPTPGKYSVAVDVREYRVINGVEQLIGTTRRDVQLIVATCPTVRAPQLPATAGVGALPRTYTIEAGTTLTIPITATQRDNHPLTMTASSELLDGVGGFNATLNNNPGTAIGLTGAATATGTGSVVGTFVYSASCTEARATPYDITVEVRDDGCAGKTIYDVFRVTVVNPTGPKTITGDAAVCVGNAPSSYTAGGGASGSATGVTWSVTGGTIVGSNTANPVQVQWATIGTGTLTVRGVSQGGCLTDAVTKNVTIGTAPTLAVAGNRTICPGTSTSITVSGAGTGATYTVTGGPVSGSGTTFVLTPTTTTTYTITSAATTTSCASTTQVVVTVSPTAVATAGPAVATTTGQPVTIGAAPVAGYTYSWSPATGLSSTTVANPTVTLTNTTGAPITQTYTLTVTNTTGCTGTASVAVTVNVDPTLVFYNIITPNGDGLNDKLQIKNAGSYPGSTVEIYNRWGRQVFATNSYDNNTNYWGTDPAITSGTYYYIFKQTNGATSKGWVQVVK
jgi:gliding motility-associated-like protein